MLFNHQATRKNILGYYTETTRWTSLTQECYERGCRCHGCLYSKFNNGNCRAKACVLELVRLYGKPENIKQSVGRGQYAVQHA